MKNNILANGLLMVIGLLLILAAFQMFGWGRGISDLAAEGFDPNQLVQLQVDGAATGARSIDDKFMDQISEAPLFRADRLPFVPPEDLENEDKDEGEVTVEAQPLKARVTSVIITDETKYAMVLDETTNERLTLTQGMPLPGEQGLWVVAAIESRMVRFEAEGEEPVELELAVFEGSLSGGNNRRFGKNKRNNRNNKNNKNETPAMTRVDDKNNQKNSAEEIRKKIAERRAQMRANAAKGNKNE